jgi:Fic family protein
MQSLDIKYVRALKFTSDNISTLKTIGEYKGKQDLFTHQTPEALETLRMAAVVKSTESSNRIEGITAPHKRIENLVLKSTAPKNRSEQEIAGYRDALNLIHESAKEMNLSVNIILQLHSVIYRYLPGQGGRWKMADNEIVEKDQDGFIKKIRFKPVKAVATAPSMGYLVERYNEDIIVHNQEPLVLIPLAILDFLCIHPFTDGNGRVARLITLLMLYHHGYNVGRYISLERIFEESKESYYETLEKSSVNWHAGTHDIFPWMTYFWGTLLRAYKEFEERVGTITTFKGSKTELVKSAVRRRIKPFSISDIMSECPGISRDMIRLVLRQLRDESRIKSLGVGRSSKWINSSFTENP